MATTCKQKATKMDGGFVKLTKECYRLARTMPWRPEDAKKERDWDDYKYQIMRNASLGQRIVEFKYDPMVEQACFNAGFVVSTVEADEKAKICKKLLVHW